MKKPAIIKHHHSNIDLQRAKPHTCASRGAQTYTESATSAYGLAYAKSYGMTGEVQQWFRSSIKFAYPKTYSWTEFARQMHVNMGLIVR